MNSRQVKLIQSILDAGHYEPIKYFAEVLACSERTVHSDTQVINSFFEDAGLMTRIVGKRGGGIKADLHPEERSTLEGLIQQSTFAVYPNLERFYRGIFLLTCPKGKRYSVTTLSQALLTNKNQLQEDLRQWNHLLSFYNCSLKNERYLSLKGDEFAIRSAVSFLFYSFAPHSMKQEIEPYFKEDMPLLLKIVQMFERSQGYPFSSNARHSVMFSFGLILSRVRDGHLLKNRVKGFELPPVILTVGAYMEKRLNKPLNQAEYELLYTLKVCSTYRLTIDNARKALLNPEAKLFAHEISRMFSTQFAKELPEETEAFLAPLLDMALERTIHDAPATFSDPFVVKYSNMHCYLTFTHIVSSLESLRDRRLFGSDLDRMALLLVPYLETACPRDECKVVLITNAGIEQSRYSQYRLERLFPAMNIVDAIPDYAIGALETNLSSVAKDVDFFITFEKIHSRLPVCQISSAIDDDDIKRVSDFIFHLKTTQEGSNLAFELRENAPLKDSSLFDIIHLLYRDFTKKGIIDIDEDRFTYIFNSHCFIMDDVLIMTAFLPEIKQSISCSYQTMQLYIGQKITRLAVLLVAEHDAELLSSIVLQFKNSLNMTKPDMSSYEIPAFIYGKRPNTEQ